MREINAWRQVLRATATRHSPIAAAVASDRQRLSRLRRNSGNWHRLNTRPVNTESRKIPVLVRLHNFGRRPKAVRKFNRNLASCITDNMPVADDKTKLAASINQRTAAI
jgi:hypothetical protein